MLLACYLSIVYTTITCKLFESIIYAVFLYRLFYFLCDIKAKSLAPKYDDLDGAENQCIADADKID